MAFDFTVQHRFPVADGFVEKGHLSFTTTSVTVEVPTKHSKIYSGFGVTQDGAGVSQDATITDGCVTFTRPSGGTSGATFDYELYGR
jgi:hypothetical protein